MISFTPFSDSVIENFQNAAKSSGIPLMQHHISQIHQRAKPKLDQLHSHFSEMARQPEIVEKGAGLLDWLKNRNPPKGSMGYKLQKMREMNEPEHYSNIIKNIYSDGGSIRMGGSIHMGGNLKTHKELYHFALELSPKEFELLREIAVQILGGKPSQMWGRLVEPEPLESDVEHYRQVIRMPNQHSTAKMLEAEHGYGKGGGFGKAFRHVARVATKVYKFGRGVLGIANRNKDLLLSLVPEEYKGHAEMFLETANRIDDAVNPIVDATIDAVKENSSQADKEKLKRMAEDKIAKVIEEKVPKGKEIVQLSKEIQSKMYSAKAD